uniref:Uncharacterized protein n=1 Tax=uncultured marine virus TaxID=186617 RepID=A0A0F7L945_9VIRU|nr:hypothetical protein [uncultured marine virus]
MAASASDGKKYGCHQKGCRPGLLFCNPGQASRKLPAWMSSQRCLSPPPMSDPCALAQCGQLLHE